MKKLASIIITISIISMLVLLVIQTKSIIETDIFQVNNGFGYSISYKQKVLIKQRFIPAIEEEVPFCSEKDALLIANLVKSKLEKNESPTISTEELKNLNIQTKCSN